MTFRRAALLLLVATLAAMLSACGSNSSSPQQVTLSYSAPQYTPPSSMTAGTSAGFAVTATNGSANATLNWSVSCSQASCGTFSPASTASTVVTTYTAPASVPSGGLTVTVTTTYSGVGTATPLSSQITINPPTISVTFSTAPPSSMLISGTTSVAATVTGDSSNAGVNWTVTCNSAQCGGFNPSHTASGATTQFTAPAPVPAGTTVTVTATSAASSSAFVQATITITSNITVTFTSAPPASVLIDSQTNLAATVTNDPGSAGVSWSCTPASLCGTFTPATTASGATTVYTAPAAVPAGNTVTITATAVDDYTKSTTPPAIITITSNITVAFTSPGYVPPASMNTNTQVEIAAFTTNDPTNAGVNWTVTCGSAGLCGSFDPTTPTLNNVPVTYTAPLAVPTGTTVTVTATSVSDFNKSKSANITITQPPTTLPDGTYVFQLSGEDNNGQSPFYVAGAFSIKSGAFNCAPNCGEQDFVDFTLQGSDAIAADSTITTTTDSNLQIVLDTSDSSIGLGGNGLETLNVALVTPSTGLVTWFDGFAAGSGTITLQDSTASQALPKYGYAFLTSGYDVNGFPVAIGGIIKVDDLNGAGTISGTGSVFDINDSGALGLDQSLSPNSSTVTGPAPGSTTPDPFGKVVFTLTPSAASGVSEIALVGYIIDSSAATLVETADAFVGTTGGTALAQGQANTGKFSTSSLSGSSYVVGGQGQDPDFLDFVGSLTFESDGSVSGTTDFNDLTLESSLSPGAGSYTVDSTGTGRATVTNLTGTDLNLDSGPATLQLYLDGNGNALVASMDANDVTAGPAYQQTSGASFSGSYALGATGVSGTTVNFWSAAGPINMSSNGAIGSGSFTDFNYFNTSHTPDVSLTGTVATPSGTITGLGADVPANSDTFDFYVIDGLRAFGIETDTTQLGLLYFQQPPTPKPHTKTHK